MSGPLRRLRTLARVQRFLVTHPRRLAVSLRLTPALVRESLRAPLRVPAIRARVAKARHPFQGSSYQLPVLRLRLENGIEVAYVDQGRRDGQVEDALIFIHGLGSYLPGWQKVVTRLSDSYRCIALDLPGYGRSERGRFPISMQFYADVVLELADALGLSTVTLCGHSMGGQIAMTAALERSIRVSRLILVDPAGFEQFNRGERQYLRDLVKLDVFRKASSRQVRKSMADNFHRMPEDAGSMVEDLLELRRSSDFELYCYALSRSIEGMVNEPVLRRLKEIEQPTLILFGEEDQLIPNRLLHRGRAADIAKIGASRIPNSRLELIPACGHFASFEKPDEVAGAIRRFLGENPG